MNELEDLLTASRADDQFKEDVRAFHRGVRAERIDIRGYAPAVKVQRLLKHVLATESTLPIERLELSGSSGCSDFVGTVNVHTASGASTYEFVWDCRWKAEEEGWTDCFGFPDQMRAAREHDWRCFKVWRSREPRG